MFRSLKEFYNKPAFRKDGSSFIWALLFIIVLFTITGVFLSVVNSTQVYKSADTVVEGIGKTRVQAIDIPLKEELGIIEVIHNTDANGNFTGQGIYPADLISSFNEKDSNRSEDPTPGYDKAILPKNNSSYSTNVTNADDTAKDSGIHSLLNKIKHFSKDGSNDENNSMLSASKDNFCIEVFPLPDGDIKVSDDFKPSCSVSIDGSIEDIAITAKDGESIIGMDNPLLNSTSVSESGGEHKKLQVHNAVFVGFAYYDTKALFYSTLSKLGGDIVDPPLRTVYRIVYPQIDAHSFESNSMDWNKDDGSWDIN